MYTYITNKMEGLQYPLKDSLRIPAPVLFLFLRFSKFLDMLYLVGEVVSTAGDRIDEVKLKINTFLKDEC